MDWRIKIVFLLFLGMSPVLAQSVDEPNRPALENHQWNIVSYFDGAKMAVPLRKMPVELGRYVDWPWPNITFAKGAISGSPGCAGLQGEYSLSGDKLKMKTGWFLAGLCPREATAQDGAVCDDLNNVRSWRWWGDQIELVDAEGRVRVALRP